MKNKYKFILAALAILPVSCTEFLTELPSTSVVAENAYSSKVTVEADVNGVYSGLQYYCGASFTQYVTNSSGYQNWTGNRTTIEWTQSEYLTLFSESSANSTLYKTMYSAISKANSLIEGIRNSSFDDEYKSQIEAEGRFLRAYFYFTLVRIYGDVPLIDFVAKELSDVNIPRTPYQQVYKFILDDLDYAFENMRTKEEAEAAAPNLARCYNYAAMAVKGEVLMWIACLMECPEDQWMDLSKEGRYPDFSNCGLSNAKDAWTKSLECSEKVINDPESPYALEPDFRNLFRWDPEEHPEDYSSPERIITVQNTITASSNGMVTWGLWSNPYGTLSYTGKWSNAGRQRPSRFTWNEWGKRHGGVAGGNANFPDVYTTIPDPRIPVTYAYSKVIAYDANVAGATKTSTVFPSATSAGNSSTNHYYIKCFSKTINANNGSADSYVMRMGTVYLNAAEAAASLDQKDKAVGYLNALYQRARVSKDGEPAEYPKDRTASEFTTTKDLVNTIMWERVFEQDGEGHSIFDTHRRGAQWLIDNIIKPFNEYATNPIMATLVGQIFYSTKASFGAKYREDYNTVKAALLGAFPKYELQYNTALDEIEDQNDFFIQ